MSSRGIKIAGPLALVLVLLFFISPALALTIDLTGPIRDFKRGDQAGGHPDFEDGISGVVTGIVQTILGADGKPVYYTGDVGPFIGSTHGVTAFNQWYNDVVGVNLSTPLTITLDNTITADPSIYTYINGAFFPIDGLLWGNQELAHNYHFTYQLHTSFTYQGGETFSFVGDDDLWVFINKQLAIDLGGVHGAAGASVNLNTLGLTVGNAYDFDLFFAERHTVASTFRIDTSILLQSSVPEPIPEPTTLILLGSGLPALAALRKRFKKFKVRGLSQ